MIGFIRYAVTGLRSIRVSGFIGFKNFGISRLHGDTMIGFVVQRVTGLQNLGVSGLQSYISQGYRVTES